MYTTEKTRTASPLWYTLPLNYGKVNVHYGKYRLLLK